jgi:hypothetical protein
MTGINFYMTLEGLHYSEILTNIESESYVMTDGQSASLSWNEAPNLELTTRFLLLSESCGLFNEGRSL